MECARRESRELVAGIVGIPGRAGSERGRFGEQRVFHREDDQASAAVFRDGPGIAQRARGWRRRSRSGTGWRDEDSSVDHRTRRPRDNQADEDTLDVHLIDGTYELFRHYYALPSARDQDGREVAAVRGVVGIGARDDQRRRDPRRRRDRSRDRVVPQPAVARLQDRRGHRSGSAARSFRCSRKR